LYFQKKKMFKLFQAWKT